MGQVLGAHSCNPSNSGGKDQEDHGSRPAWAKSEILSQKQPTHKKTAGEVVRVI
jgi:hypothetical protein